MISELHTPYTFLMKTLLQFTVLWMGLSCLLCAQDGKALYQSYCAGCHGAQLEGNTASALIKEDWVYGRGQIARNIRFGIPGTEMIGWESALDNTQIRTLVQYITEAQTTPPTTIRPFPTQIKSEEYTLKIEVLVDSGITLPWGIEFLDEQRALITEQPGSLRWLINGKLDPNLIQGLPPVHDTGRGLGGLMDVAVDPDYETNGWVYLAYSHTKETLGDRNSLAMTRVIRGKINDHQWTEQQVLFEAPDSLRVRKGTRWGCRLLFDKEGYLYFTIGDMDVGEDSQDLSKPNGKVFRIYPDGSIPPDNPFAHIPNALPAIYTLGNRNTQGISQHPVTGEIWSTDHGPMGGDELNILEKGANYGWPSITYGKDYNGSVVSDKTHQEGMQQPIIHWTPSIAVCPAEFNTYSLFLNWENNLFVGALAYEELRRLVVEDRNVVKQEIILKNHGRIRDIKFSPSGALYLLVNKPDAILRLTPIQTTTER